QTVPKRIYRGATRGNVVHVTPRAGKGETAVSFRESLSNPMPQNGPSVLKPGGNFIEVDPNLLPPGTVILDGGLNGLPPGHVSVTATPEEIVRATIGGGKLPKQ